MHRDESAKMAIRQKNSHFATQEKYMWKYMISMDEHKPKFFLHYFLLLFL